MSSNPLPPILEAYETAKDSFKIAKRAIQTQTPQARTRLLQRTGVENTTLSEAQRRLEDSQRESNALFVLALWATFERFLRDYLQQKGTELLHIKPPILGNSVYEHFEKEVEFWKTTEILEFLKESLFRHQPDLIGQAKQILAYRDWIAHGKNPKKLPATTPKPTDVYKILNEIVVTLLLYSS